RVRREDGSSPEIERIVDVLVEDTVDLGGPDPVGQERGHHRSSAAAHDDVEPSALAIEPFLEGGQGSDLVHAANDPTAAQGQRQPHPGTPLPGLARAPESAGTIKHRVPSHTLV